jgi:hypothetical protein
MVPKKSKDESSEIKKSPRVLREEKIAAMSQEELAELAIYMSRKIQEAKAMLRIAVKTFRWVQKPAEAQDIERFLNTLRDDGRV